MGKLRAFAAAGVLAALAACSRPAPPRDVAYFAGHPDVRAQTLAACRNDRGRLAATSDCINALAADGAETSKRFWTSPAPASRLHNPSKL